MKAKIKQIIWIPIQDFIALSVLYDNFIAKREEVGAYETETEDGLAINTFISLVLHALLSHNELKEKVMEEVLASATKFLYHSSRMAFGVEEG